MFTLYVLITTCCVLIASVCCRLAWRRFKFCLTLSWIPGPKGLPILGNVLQLKRDPHEYLNQLHDWCTKYDKGLFCMWFGPSPLVVIYSPEFAEVVLSSTKNINKSEFYTLLHPWLGTGILTSSGDKWKSRRKIVTSAFHFKILDNFTTLVQQHGRNLIRCLEKHCGKSKFDISTNILLCTLDVICETAMGVNVKAQNDSTSQYAEALLSVGEMLNDRLKKPWLWNDMIYMQTATGIRFKMKLDILRAFTNKIIDDRINARKEMKSSDGPGKPGIYTSSQRKLLALLDLLLEDYDAGNISKEGIREEVDTFTFAGQDTTSSSMLWIIHLVGKHPDVQSKLQQEADSFYGSMGESVITLEDLKQLDFTECVIKESMRLFPPAPFFGRAVDEECHLGPYLVPKGANYAILLGPLHRHPNHWKDPDTFKPERFCRRNYEDRRHPYSYIPFSAGPRNCIGQRFAVMEMKIIISMIFHHFHVNATQETDKIRRTGDVILRSLDGIWVELKARK